MPELPEVELGRKIAEGAAAGRRVAKCKVDDDRIVFDGVAPRTVKKTLVGADVTAVRRHGKHLWFELAGRPAALFHFGMTGAFRVPNATPLRLESSPKKLDTSWPPRFSKIHMTFDDGGELVMVNSRRLGRIRFFATTLARSLRSPIWVSIPCSSLPKLARFRELLGRRSVTLKGLLLDQSFAAGVGNWIADEVLFQAGLDPRRRVTSLTPEEQKRLRAKLKLVIDKAVSVDANKERFPKSWLFHHRWGKQDDARTSKGDVIEHLTVAGRTTAWVPAVQS